LAGPTASDAIADSGYAIGRVYAVQMRYDVHAGDLISGGAARADTRRLFNIGWDWKISGRRAFDVVIAVHVHPSPDTPDEANVSVAASFQAADGPLSVSPREFVRYHAPAILLPFAREMLADLTRRGPFGPFLLMPLNLPAVMATMDESRSSGYVTLQSDATAAEEFGLAAEWLRDGASTVP
jgi:preprotein translocase subunit SecB